MRFVFWQNMLTHHQAPWLAALATLPGVDVVVAAEEEIAGSRREMGWQHPDYGAASVVWPLLSEVIIRVIRDAGPRAVHVFSGIGAYQHVHSALLKCMRLEMRAGFMAESSSSNGFAGLGRFVAGYLRRLRYGQAIDFVLAIGEAGPMWFRRLGFPPGRIFEFAYFPPAPAGSERQDKSLAWPNGARLLYVGQLIRRKRVDLLLNVMGTIGGQCSLRIIGSGPEESTLRALTHRLGIAEKVIFSGAMINSSAMAAVNGADVLVLPSRFDGYGAVVNEALLRGVPVICSNHCGAQQVVTMHSDFGMVFESQDDLRAALEYYIALGRRTETRTASIRSLAQCVEPETGVRYFLEVVRHVYEEGPRPAPPWRSCRQNGALG